MSKVFQRSIFCILSFLIIHCSISQSTKDWLQKSRIGSLEEQFNAYSQLTKFYEYDKPDSALWAALQMIVVSNELKENVKRGDAYRLAGWSFINVGLINEAIAHLHKAINLYDSSQLITARSNMARCYDHLAWAYIYLEDFSKPDALLKKALSINPLENRSDSLQQAYFFHSLGSLNSQYLSVYDSAEYYLSKAISWRQMLNSSIESIARAQVELRNNYILDKRFMDAEKQNVTLISLPKDSISGYIMGYQKYNDALIFHELNEYYKALILLDEIYSLMKDNGNDTGEIGLNLIRQQIKSAKAGGFFEKAFEYSELLRALERETVFKDRQRTAKALEILHETADKEQRIAIQSEEIRKTNQLLWTALVFILIVLGLGLNANRSRLKIKQKNKKIETLMRELHHRVKNNLQVISSLLGLQSMKLTNPEAKKAVDEGNQRIRAMSLIHKKLYHQDEVSALDIQEYLTELVTGLKDSFGHTDSQAIHVDVPQMAMNVDTALSLGLIVNELVINAFKYAFDDIEDPLLELKLIQEDKHGFVLSLRDNGNGLPPGFDFTKAESFGLRLVNILAKQLNGTLTWENNNGLHLQLKFQAN